MARKFLLNPGSKTLHIQDGCDYARNNTTKYLIFASEEAVSEYTKGKYKWCKTCYKKKDLVSIEPTQDLIETDLTDRITSKKEKYEKFQKFFGGLAIASAACGLLFAIFVKFWIGLILGGGMFFAFSLIGGFLDDSVNFADTNKSRKKAISKGKWYSFLSVLIACVIFIAAFVISNIDLIGTEKDPFKDTFNKDPNEWTEDEEEYVNDLFEWIDKHDKDK